MSSGLSRRGLFSLFARSFRAPDEGVKAAHTLPMNQPTPTPPRRGALPVPLLGGVGVGPESPCAREVRGVLSGKAENSLPAPDPQPRVAVIQGRFCLAYTSFCTVCVERCPVPNAMKVEKGIPMVVADACTGCGVCHDVCPAPTNAVLVLPRRRIPRFTSPPPPPAAA